MIRLIRKMLGWIFKDYLESQNEVYEAVQNTLNEIFQFQIQKAEYDYEKDEMFARIFEEILSYAKRHNYKDKRFRINRRKR